jgi:hypothetical protein
LFLPHLIVASGNEQSAVEAAFAVLNPSITRFLIEGVPYDDWYDAVNEPRFTQFFESFTHAAIILELGFLEGGHTIALASRCAVSSGSKGVPQTLNAPASQKAASRRKGRIFAG